MGDNELTPEQRADFTLDIYACNAAEAFTDAYYRAHEKSRATLSTFYVPATIEPSELPYITWNGAIYKSGAALQDHIETLTHTHYEVESLDAAVLNRTFIPAEAVGGEGKDPERRMSIQLSVAGNVRLEEPLKGPLRPFAETFVLVPNLERLKTGRPEFKNGWDMEWLVQTQNFRFTEWGAGEVPGTGKKEAAKVEKMEVEGVKNGNRFTGGGRGIANQFAAAGLLKGKGKA